MMRKVVVGAMAASAVAGGFAFSAKADEKCFDKGSLSYVDCPKPAPAPEPAPAPIVEPKANWTGWYLGAHAGYGEGDIDADYVDGVDQSADLDAKGGLVGAQAAYLHHFDNDVVLGVEIDGTAAFFDEERDLIAGDLVQHEGEVDYLASARVKVGYAIDTFLPFVTGGVALAGWEYDLTDAVVGGGAFSADGTTVGGVFGGGFDYMWTENWIVGAEGLYYFFDDSETITLPVADPGSEVEFDDVVVGRIRVTYKF